MDSLFGLLERGVIRIGIAIQELQADLRAFLRRYRNLPMSLADACLKFNRAAEVLTLNTDFRLSSPPCGNQVIRCVCRADRTYDWRHECVWFQPEPSRCAFVGPHR